MTHQLQYLPSADEVVVLRDGRVAERGTYRQLLARGVDFHQFEQEEEEQEGAASPAGSKEDSAGAEQLHSAEELSCNGHTVRSACAACCTRSGQ